MKINLGSIKSLITGGIDFATPFPPIQPVPNGMAVSGAKEVKNQIVVTG